MKQFGLTDEEKKKIQEKHDELEKKERERKENLNKGTIIKKK